MNKGTNLISEIGKYFKENDATNAINKIMEITAQPTNPVGEVLAH